MLDPRRNTPPRPLDDWHVTFAENVGEACWNTKNIVLTDLFTGKVRCDRGVPKCGRCARLDYDCSYQGRKRYRAAQADMPRQLSELRTRLGKSRLVPQHLLFGAHVSLFIISTGLSLILFGFSTYRSSVADVVLDSMHYYHSHCVSAASPCECNLADPDASRTAGRP